MRFNPDEYVTVAERISKFYAKYEQGRILTSVLEHNEETGFVLIKAEIYRDATDAMASSSGHAYELRSAGHVQQGSYIEVCETSAVGRALALLGFSVDKGVASREEVQRAEYKRDAQQQPTKLAKPADPEAKTAAELVTPRQLEEIRDRARGLAVDADEACMALYGITTEKLNRDAAMYFIAALNKKKMLAEAPQTAGEEQPVGANN